ncbi:MULTISPECIES: serine hydrolase domain-containing protein [Bradyrhizobium]|uniref:CubicO group peptidase, beta-lactamase class C family n=2 Tax=Bradyrhizobium TaxID=374 RepID=A0ABY0PS34_9BRAD|nr:MULTISPECIES: serine hydrolase [Bradyrhizobium]SDI72195.1 CubicO group peptidase, beta-lactamase class C family [Bradyrhizobium ottawaense]SED25893.1 CubicO group peptidase, beta-lactamase class C family [Bradyrhizobium lablabi]SHL29579.1 CubicO group peptidase, beta-lactamase class C family [Bradyrhizobium lablabi]
MDHDAVASPKFHVPAGEDFLLLSPTAQAYAYRNVDRMFATRPIRRGKTVLPLQRGREISPQYQTDQGAHGVDAYIDRANVAGLLVIKNEQIVLERYSLGLEENLRWSSMSMIKSLTSTLVGAALQQGAISSLDDAVSRYIPALRGCAYDAVTVRSLLTMSSGVRWSEDYTDRNSDVNRYSKSLGDKVPGGVLALMRNLKAEHPPASHFSYNTGDTYVLGCLVSAATGKNLADFMSETIWSPLGMEFDAFYTLESENGQEIGGSRAGIALRDFGRFGVFLLRNGVIDGKPVLPPDWIESAGRRAFAFDAETNRYGATGYGYSWWIDPDDSMVAVGFAGQSLYVNRKARVVIVTLSCQPQPPYSESYRVDLKAEYHAFKNAVLAEIG